MDPLLDMAVDSLRWARVNNRRKRHLWLGSATACGISEWHTLSIDAPEEACASCAAYGRGWLDRHVFGSNPPIDRSPIAASTRLPANGGERRATLAERVEKVAMVRAKAAEKVALAHAWTADDWDDFVDGLLLDLDKALGEDGA
ncbi:hypothetical protein CFH99_07930 [Nocardioides aromaticivorans]|uniref:Uncharacterized protein n=1 Tax=Nocardioides aromaticivorans TaxID=200618 RepID=A0ABX7PI06_9ACTN|nr:hypothetical protein [Nocardioides aromaticivorans]QSR25550.1 hypothetical protein CFH99_07930 [Nocardioides aromaticivorans]